jgi:oxygen-independent coproporphyrinogen-3 oxidase
MAGIYIHIPFCKRICSYCDFYKSTLTAIIPDFLSALEQEAEIQKSYLDGEVVDTLYFGGGTPSLLKPLQIEQIITVLRRKYTISPDCEITVEANPDDLSPAYLKALIGIDGLNRLSIGIQSFNDADLRFLNRRHNAAQAMASIEYAREAGFRNISIDLIYGIPGMTTVHWKRNLDRAKIADHLSAYHLSIEPKTELWRLKTRGLLSIASEDESTAQFETLGIFAEREGFIHYEISNLAKPGFYSRHNSNYWLQSKYLGLGPSAHSYDIHSRQWNGANVKQYISCLNEGRVFHEKEQLTVSEQYNEYVMVSLRTIWGVNMDKLITSFGPDFENRFLKAIQPELKAGRILQEGNIFRMSRNAWLISDHILSAIMV